MTSAGRDVQRCSCAFDVRNISSNARRSNVEGIIETRVRAPLAAIRVSRSTTRAPVDDDAIFGEIAHVDLEVAAAIARDRGAVAHPHRQVGERGPINHVDRLPLKQARDAARRRGLRRRTSATARQRKDAQGD